MKPPFVSSQICLIASSMAAGRSVLRRCLWKRRRQSALEKKRCVKRYFPVWYLVHVTYCTLIRAALTFAADHEALIWIVVVPDMSVVLKALTTSCQCRCQIRQQLEKKVRLHFIWFVILLIEKTHGNCSYHYYYEVHKLCWAHLFKHH